MIFALAPQSRPQSPSASNMAAEGANLVACLWLFARLFAKLKKKKKFSSLEAIEVFLRLILFFLRDCVKNVPFYNKFVGLKENF